MKYAQRIQLTLTYNKGVSAREVHKYKQLASLETLKRRNQLNYVNEAKSSLRRLQSPN
jgi:hypothetical protein